MLAHSVPETDTMKSLIDLAEARNVGYVYVTDDTPPNPYNSLPAYWQAEVDHLAARCRVYMPAVLRDWPPTPTILVVPEGSQGSSVDTHSH